MKIAFYSILNLGYGAGFERWVEKVATILSSRGHQIIILTTEYGENQNKMIQKNLYRHDVRVFEYENYQRLFVIPTISAIRQIAKIIENIDVLYFNNAFPLNEVIVLLLKRGNNQNIKVISGYHGLFPQLGNMMTRLYYRIVNKSISKKFDAFHVLNAEDQSRLQSWHYRNIYNFPNGVDTVRYIPGQKKNIFTVMFAGRIVYQKGIDILAEVIRKINNSQEKNLNFRIFGAGPLAYIVEDLEKKFSNVMYSSYVDEEDLIEAFKSAHVFVSPSRFETFLLTSLEAQSSGTPVIASDIAGPRETVISGQTGLLVNATQNEILNAISYFKDLWDNRRQLYFNYCQNARRNALRYDWKITVDSFEQMLSSMVNK